MADDRLIGAYLRELAFSVAGLPDADDIVAEAEDHLREAAAGLEAEGRSAHEAESEAVARFGSAELIARVCVRESKRGAAVPTTRTRWAGLALAAVPAMLIVGQWANTTFEVNDESTGHGVGVLLLTLSFPALIFGLWGLSRRHGGLGRSGLIAFALAAASPLLSMAAGWGALLLLLPLLCMAVLVFAIQMLRASVLPVAPLVLIVAGPTTVFVLGCVALGISLAGNDAGDLFLLAIPPLMLTVGGLTWLGVHLWTETAVDGTRTGRLATS